MWKLFFVILTMVFVLRPAPVLGQAQEKCEARRLQDAQAQEVLSGPEHEILMQVASSFGLTRLPRLYLIPGNGSAYYVVGSVFSDGRGTILLSRNFVRLMGGNTLALKGIVAHEVAHVVADNGRASCDDWIMRDPRAEEEADSLASSKVGVDPLRAFLSQVVHLTGGKNSQGLNREVRTRLSRLMEVQKQRRR